MEKDNLELICKSLNNHRLDYKDFNLDKMRIAIKTCDTRIHLNNGYIGRHNLSLISRESKKLNFEEILDILELLQSGEAQKKYPECFV